MPIPLPSVLEACVGLTRDARVLRMEAERLDTLLNQTARKIMHLAMASGFKTWKSQYVEAKAERTRLDNLFKKVVGRFKNKMLAAAWAAWKQHVEESQRLRGSAHKVVARMTRVKMAGAFAGWASSFNSARAQQATATKVLGRICNMKMAAALSGWQSALTAAKTRRTILTRVLAKMLNRCMSAAFDAWLKQTRETKRLQSQLRKIVLKFKNAALSRAYEGCAPLLHIHQATESLTENCRGRWKTRVAWVKRSKHLLAKAKGAFKHQDMARAWRTWLHMAMQARALSGREGQAKQKEMRDEIARQKILRTLVHMGGSPQPPHSHPLSFGSATDAVLWQSIGRRSGF